LQAAIDAYITNPYESERGIALDFTFCCSTSSSYITPAAAKNPCYLTARAEKD
jgi:hypothetical protein